MVKRASSAVAGILTLGLSLSGFAQADVLTGLNSSSPRLPLLQLSDVGSFAFPGTFSWIEQTPPDFLPALSAPATRASRKSSVVKASATMPVQDSSKEGVELQRSNFFTHAGGEVGVSYGRSLGKSGGSAEQGYIIGEVGNDKLQITAGASYENTSGRFSRFGR